MNRESKPSTTIDGNPPKRCDMASLSLHNLCAASLKENIAEMYMTIFLIDGQVINTVMTYDAQCFLAGLGRREDTR